MPNAMVIDLSHHNASVDFQKIRAADVVGVIHKATQGTGFVDDKYAARKPAALAAGLLWGAYHFGTGDDVDAQVSHFINTVQPDGSFVLVLDFEKNTTPPMNSMSLDQAKEFLTAVEQQTGEKPVLYTSSFLTDTCGSAAIPDLAQYRVWWARYSNTPHLHATFGRAFGSGNIPTGRMDKTSRPSTVSGLAIATPSPATKRHCVRAGWLSAARH